MRKRKMSRFYREAESLEGRTTRQELWIVKKTVQKRVLRICGNTIKTGATV